MLSKKFHTLIAIKFFMLTLLSMIAFGCSVSKPNTDAMPDRDAQVFIELAISDFVGRNYRGTNYVAYSVTTHTLENDIIAVSILGSTGKMIVTPDKGYKSLWANQHLESGGKLFYWRNEIITDNRAIEVLFRYDLIDTVKSLSEAELVIDHTKKSYDYYFCINDPSTFKVVKSSRLVGDYKIPKLGC